MTKKLRNNGRPRPREGISDIAAYVPGRHKVKGSGKLHRLSSNETPLGASPNARAAYADVAQKLELYPDGAATELRQAIADVHGLNADNLICGAGSDELLNLLAYAYLGSGDEAVYSRHGFLVYEIAIRAAGAIPVIAAETNLTADVDALLGAVTPKTRVVFLANPNNPTGTYLPFDEIKRLHQGLADDVLLVLDAAYAEYVRRNDYESGLELVSTSNNVVMTRTFSKIHGLASLRLGWAYAPAHIIDVLNRIRGPFNVSGPAIAAGIAAIKDREFVETAVRHNNKWLDWLTEQIGALGLDVTPSVGNFILIHFPDKTGKTASDADAYLSERACLLRAVTGYGLPDALRMSVGTEEANRTVVEHLTAFMKN